MTNSGGFSARVKPAGTFRSPGFGSFLIYADGLKSTVSFSDLQAGGKRFLNGRFATPPAQRCGRCSGSVCRRHRRAGGNLPVHKCNLNITIACIYLSVFEGLTCCLCAPPPRLCRRNLGGGACCPWFALDLGELTRFYGLDLVCAKCSTDVCLFL